MWAYSERYFSEDESDSENTYVDYPDSDDVNWTDDEYADDVHSRVYEHYTDKPILLKTRLHSNNSLHEHRGVCAQKNNSECPICLELFIGCDPRVFCSYQCGCVFHTCCIRKLITKKNVCPHCRSITFYKNVS
jgi:hypothetical protein